MSEFLLRGPVELGVIIYCRYRPMINSTPPRVWKKQRRSSDSFVSHGASPDLSCDDVLCAPLLDLVCLERTTEPSTALNIIVEK